MSLFRSEVSKHLTSVDPNVTTLANRTFPGMAHFAGTGPEGMTCGKCQNFGKTGKGKNQPCMKFSRMMNGRDGNQIPPNTAACKYFE